MRDRTAPLIKITAPSATGTYATTNTSVNVTGTASDNVGVRKVTWVNNRGGNGTASGTTAWSASSIALRSGSNAITVTARDTAGNTKSARITVTYTPPTVAQYTLRVTRSGSGTVTSNPGGINCGSTCSASYASGTSATLTAVPASGSSFSGWSGACAGASTTCSVSMSASLSVTASFATASSTGLNLPRIPWEGSDYWKQFSKADAAGWSDPGFFPISVFLGKLSSAPELQAVGVNVFMAAEHSPQDLSLATGIGMFVMPQLDEWTPAEVGDDPNVVAWFVSDECDIGLGGCSTDAEGLPPGYPADGWTYDEYGFLSVQRWYVDKVNALNDGRFKFANYSQGINRTFWAVHTMDQFVQLVDAASADQYAYTNPDVSGEPSDYLSPDWPAGANATAAASYGWVADQLRRFQDPNKIRPVWVFIEGARPLLFNAGARTITPNQIEGAVWSAIIHEARGIAYFQHNNDESLNCGAALIDCEPARKDKIRAVNAKIKSLAPVINSQSYQYDFNNGTDTMLKTYQGSAYIFADIGFLETAGSKTFALPAGITGTTATVVGENRTLPVVGGTFVDNFAAEYTYHVYKIGL